jgi:hypothetical protein
MRGKGHGGLDSVLRTADCDPTRDRILRAQFWLTPPAPRVPGDVIALESRRTASR